LAPSRERFDQVNQHLEAA